MSKIILKKNGTDYLFGLIPLHFPADRVYLDGDTTKTVQDKCARKSDLTNLDLTGTTNTTGSTIASGTYLYLNGTLVRAKTAIANGATFTLNTNYEVVTVGGLNELLNTVSKRVNYTPTLLSGYDLISASQNYLYTKNNEVHAHLNVYKNNGNYSAGTYSYPLSIPSGVRPTISITAPCLFYSAGGAAGTQRGVPGYASIGSTGDIMVMPTDNSNAVNTVMIDIVYPID